jgi:hypothetical protein
MKSTSFALTADQEEELVDYALKRIASLEEDNQERIDADALSWDTYENSREDREVGIFAHSNTPVPLTSLVIDHFVSRAEEDLTGAPPYFRFDAQGPADMAQGKDFDRYFNWKLDTRAKIRETLEEAHLQAFVQRALILKATYKQDVTRYVDHEAVVLYDIASGVPIQIEGMGYIVEGQAVFTQAPDPMTGEPRLILEQDPSFELVPTQHEFRPFDGGVELEVNRYSGPKGVVVDYDRFLAPSTAPSLDEADFIAEKYDKTLPWVETLFLERKFTPWVEYENAVESLNAEPKTESFRDTDDKENLSFDRENATIGLVECWVRRDVLGKGYPQEFVLFLDPRTRTAIYYEYVCKVTPDHRIPYTAISVSRNRNRWWGKSIPERLNVFQEYVDKQFNSQSYRNELASNPLIAANPQALEDEPDDVELAPGTLFTLKDGYTMRDFLSVAELPKEGQKTQELIDFIFGVVQLWLGVTNLAQGDYQALAPANTATGVEATLREASKVGRRWMRRMIQGYETFLMKLVKVSIATMDQKEIYEYMEGEVRSFAEMTPQRLQNLETNVILEMSQEQSQRMVERNDLALKAMERYYSYAPELRPFAKPLLVNILKAMGFEDADRLLPEGAPDVPRDESGKPAETPPQLSGAVEGMGNSNSRGANQHQEAV